MYKYTVAIHYSSVSWKQQVIVITEEYIYQNSTIFMKAVISKIQHLITNLKASILLTAQDIQTFYFCVVTPLNANTTSGWQMGHSAMWPMKIPMKS